MITAPTPTASPTISRARTLTLPLAQPTPSPAPVTPETGWQFIRPNLERRVINLVEQDIHVESLYLLRLAPQSFQFAIAYHSEPQALDAWQTETHALIVVNGGYFRIEQGKYLPTGLTIVNGKAMGTSYGAFAGMFAVTNAGPELRWLSQKPYKQSEAVLFGLQSFPMLVKPSGVLGFPATSEDNQRARRTVIAQDKRGRILFMVAPLGHFTLYQLGAYLVASDLELNVALNLDGGTSSGIRLAEPLEEIPSLAWLPLVITVQAR